MELGTFCRSRQTGVGKRAKGRSRGNLMEPLKLHAAIEKLSLLEPFRISGHTWEVLEVLLVTLETGKHVGRGEAAGIFYLNDSPALMLKQIEALRPRIEAGINRWSAQDLLPAGGAR